MVTEEVYGVARWQHGGVVTNDCHTVPNAIMAPSMCAQVVPTSALIDVAVRTDHEAEKAQDWRQHRQRTISDVK